MTSFERQSDHFFCSVSLRHVTGPLILMKYLCELPYFQFISVLLYFLYDLLITGLLIIFDWILISVSQSCILLGDSLSSDSHIALLVKVGFQPEWLFFFFWEGWQTCDLFQAGEPVGRSWWFTALPTSSLPLILAPPQCDSHSYKYLAIKIKTIILSWVLMEKLNRKALKNKVYIAGIVHKDLKN